MATAIGIMGGIPKVTDRKSGAMKPTVRPHFHPHIKPHSNIEIYMGSSIKPISGTWPVTKGRTMAIARCKIRIRYVSRKHSLVPSPWFPVLIEGVEPENFLIILNFLNCLLLFRLIGGINCRHCKNRPLRFAPEPKVKKLSFLKLNWFC